MAKPHSVPTIREALALFNAGRLKEAEQACTRILKVQKGNFHALEILGLCAGRRNRFTDAHSYYRRALRAQPGAPIIHTHAGRLYVAEGRFDDGLREFDLALTSDGSFGPALAGKAETLTRRGDYDAARALLEPIVHDAREDGEIANVFVEILQHDGRDEDVAPLINRHLADPATNDVSRRKLLFGLGKSLDRLGLHDAAFDAYRRGNALSVAPFDIVRHRGLHDQIIATFSRERIAERPRSTNDSAVPVFVVGMPRCGSTLVEQILGAHPDMFPAGELQDVLELVRDLPKQARSLKTFPAVVDDLDQRTLDRISHRFLGRLQQRDPAADRVVDKMLDNFRFLGLIEMMLPNARVIHCRRDPMAICYSIYTLPLSPAALPYSTDLRHLGAYYREYERLMDHWSSTLDLPILEVRYEDLVQDQARISREVVDFVGLEWNDACLRFHDTGRDVATASYDQVRRPLYTTALNRYAPYERQLAPLREALGID